LAKHNKINKSKTVVNDQNEKDKSPKVSEISVVSAISTKAPRQLPPLVNKEIKPKRKHYLNYRIAKTPVKEVKKDFDSAIEFKETISSTHQTDIPIEQSKSNEVALVAIIKDETEIPVPKLEKNYVAKPKLAEEGLKLDSAPYVPKESFQRNKKWLRMEDTFTLSNFMNKNYSDLVDNAIEQVKSGNKTGEYQFPKPGALNHQMSFDNQWESYPSNLKEFNQREENKCFDYSGAGL
jgi:hypothetical protein